MASQKTEKLYQILADISGYPAEQINENTHMVNELNLSSLHRGMLVAELEDLVGKRVPQGKVKRWETVGDMTAYLGEALND